MFTSFTATFTSEQRDRLANAGERRVTCTKQADGVRVQIEGKAYYGNDFVTVSDEVIPERAWPMIKDLLKSTKNFIVIQKRGA